MWMINFPNRRDFLKLFFSRELSNFNSFWSVYNHWVRIHRRGSCLEGRKKCNWALCWWQRMFAQIRTNQLQFALYHGNSQNKWTFDQGQQPVLTRTKIWVKYLCTIIFSATNCSLLSYLTWKYTNQAAFTMKLILTLVFVFSLGVLTLLVESRRGLWNSCYRKNFFPRNHMVEHRARIDSGALSELPLQSDPCNLSVRNFRSKQTVFRDFQVKHYKSRKNNYIIRNSKEQSASPKRQWFAIKKIHSVAKAFDHNKIFTRHFFHQYKWWKE